MGEERAGRDQRLLNPGLGGFRIASTAGTEGG
jgi:hypothetical protein